MTGRQKLFAKIARKVTEEILSKEIAKNSFVRRRPKQIARKVTEEILFFEGDLAEY